MSIKSYCSCCGTANDARSYECRSCGEPLDGSAFEPIKHHRREDAIAKAKYKKTEIPDFEDISEEEIESFLNDASRTERVGDILGKSQRNK